MSESTEPLTPRPLRPDPLELYVQAVRAIEAQASATRELTGAIERGFGTTQDQHTAHTGQIAGLADAVRAQTAALEARTAVWRDLGQGLLAWFQSRWITLLIGLAVGLGLAGGRELLGALVGQLLSSPTP